MISLEQVQQLIEELGPATDEVEEVQQEDETAWTVFFGGEIAVGLDFMPDQEKLVLSTTLGAPPAERQAATYELLLRYNYNWPESGGVKMALGPESEVEMLFELNASALDLPELRRALTSFLEIGRAWRELVAVGFGVEATAEVATEELPGAIKV